MEKINSLEHFILITKQAQINKMKNLNCYLLPNEITLLTQKNALFYLINETTLQIIAKHGRYFKVYFYGTDNFSFIEFNSETLPVITDISFIEKLKDKNIILKSKLEKMGFFNYSSSSRMSSHNNDTKLIKTDYVIEKISKAEVQDVYNIWEENFDPVKNLLYSIDEIYENMDNIFVLKDDSKKVIGAMEIIFSSKYSTIQRIAIKKEYQKKRLGSCLESYYINYSKSLGFENFLLYTVDDNLKAQVFHKKFGFNFDLRHNMQFLYRR